jgi:hypothetical protein
MSVYDTLIAAWSGGTTLPVGVVGAAFVADDTVDQKLAKLNAWTITGPKQDVPISAVEGYLGLRGILTAIEDWLATNPAAGTSRTAAKELLRAIASPHVTVFQMSDPDVYARVQAMLGSLVAAPPALLTPDEEAELLALATPQVLWVAAPVSGGGAGLAAPASLGTLQAAGIVQ